MKKEVMVGILIITLLVSACTGSLEQRPLRKNEPLKLQLPQFNQVKKETPPQRQQGPQQKETKPLIPTGKHASVEECLVDWTSTLKERASFLWIKSNHIIVGFENDFPLFKAKQIVGVHGLKPEIYNPIELFPKQYWSDYTEEELFDLSHALKVEVLEGTEVQQACEFAQEEDVASAVPDLHINLFQQ